MTRVSDHGGIAVGFQTPTNTKSPDRSRHIWRKRFATENFKCCLCGAIAVKPPENHDLAWVPERYEKITGEDREAVPYHNQQAIGGR